MDDGPKTVNVCTLHYCVQPEQLHMHESGDESGIQLVGKEKTDILDQLKQKVL